MKQFRLIISKPYGILDLKVIETKSVTVWDDFNNIVYLDSELFNEVDKKQGTLSSMIDSDKLEKISGLNIDLW